MKRKMVRYALETTDFTSGLYEYYLAETAFKRGNHIIIFDFFAKASKQYIDPDSLGKGYFILLEIDKSYTYFFQGYGLCRVFCTFLLRRAYNRAVENYGDGAVDIMPGRVYVDSKVPEIAAKCYISAYSELGFTYKGRKAHSRGFIISFEKHKPTDGWKKIDRDIEYINNRSNITYTITEDEIQME